GQHGDRWSLRSSSVTAHTSTPSPKRSRARRTQRTSETRARRGPTNRPAERQTRKHQLITRSSSQEPTGPSIRSEGDDWSEAIPEPARASEVFAVALQPFK